MTTAQRIMLFKLFGQAMTAAGVVGSTARELERERLTIKVCGRAKSWNDFNNRDVDHMKSELLAIAAPGDLNAQVNQIQMPRTRLIYSIRKFPAAYFEKIARDKFDGQTDLEKLSNEQLIQLRNTLHSRRRKPQPQPATEEPF